VADRAARGRVAQQVTPVYVWGFVALLLRRTGRHSILTWPGDIADRRHASHTWVMHSSVTLTLNGENRVFEGPASGPLSLTGLLVTLGLDARKVAVERNEEIVPRSRYGETWLASGDSLEIVHFIGGG
jgi:sulfur carrier protein